MVRKLRIKLAELQLKIWRTFGFPYKWRCEEPGCYFSASATDQEYLDRIILIHTHEETPQ